MFYILAMYANELESRVVPQKIRVEFVERVVRLPLHSLSIVKLVGSDEQHENCGPIFEGTSAVCGSVTASAGQ
ncbi:MAG: hypothetical protein CMJ59_00595 [Planctomycetaceae bacterium]|nr:hypothetical protein [Planctomycetaceae bacterium]